MKTIKCALITKKRSERTFWLVCMFDHLAFLRLMEDRKVFEKETITQDAELIETEPYKFDLRYYQKKFGTSTLFEYANAPILSKKNYEEFLSTCEDEIIKVKLQNYINKFKILNDER